MKSITLDFPLSSCNPEQSEHSFILTRTSLKSVKLFRKKVMPSAYCNIFYYKFGIFGLDTCYSVVLSDFQGKYFDYQDKKHRGDWASVANTSLEIEKV